MAGAAYDARLKPTLARAAQAYRRREDSEFLALLGEAIALAPHRLDLRCNLANHYVQIGAPDMAVATLRELCRLAPRDVEALFRLAAWLDFFDEADESQSTLNLLAEVRPESAADFLRLHDTVHSWLDRAVTDQIAPPAHPAAQLAVVVLGYVLNPDGGMRPMLIERLEKVRRIAAAFPEARIVVSGGVPHAGKVEAVEMRRWLAANGVDDERIIEEGYARDLVENLIYSRQILDIIGMRTALIVTSAGNVRRAGAAMEILAWKNGSPWKTAVVAASGENYACFSDDGGDKLKLYRDALRAYGLPMMRTFPELVEL